MGILQCADLEHNIFYVIRRTINLIGVSFKIGLYTAVTRAFYNNIYRRLFTEICYENSCSMDLLYVRASIIRSLAAVT